MVDSASQPFDPYRRWLGIPPHEQPADHYRLLGITRFESDAEVIESGADRQMAHVRRYQAGPYRAVSQQVLNALARARVVLLDPAKKAAYDEALRARLAAAQTNARGPVVDLAVPAAPAPAAASPTPANSELDFVHGSIAENRAPAGRSSARKRQPKRSSGGLAGAIIGGALVAIAGIGWFAFQKQASDGNRQEEVASNSARSGAARRGTTRRVDRRSLARLAGKKLRRKSIHRRQRKRHRRFHEFQPW